METRVWSTCPCGWRSFCEAPGHTSAWDGEGSLAVSLSCCFLCWDLFILLWETSAPLPRTPTVRIRPAQATSIICSGQSIIDAHDVPQVPPRQQLGQSVIE